MDAYSCQIFCILQIRITHSNEMIIDPLTAVFSMSPMGWFCDYKMLVLKALALIAQHAASELLL